MLLPSLRSLLALLAPVGRQLRLVNLNQIRDSIYIIVRTIDHIVKLYPVNKVSKEMKMKGRRKVKLLVEIIELKNENETQIVLNKGSMLGRNLIN